MRIPAFFTVILVLVVSTLNLIAQSNEITRDEYYALWSAALERGRRLNRRITSKMEVYGNGEVTSNENWIYEYDLPSSIRYVHTGNLNGRTFQIEEIDIGRIKYCKKDKADWNRVKDFCIFAPARGFEDKTSLKYTLEKVIFNGKDANLYTQYNTYKNIFSKNKDSEGLSYDETKYWLNKDGLLLLEEYKSGLIAPKTVNWVRIVTHEYNPKDLKIGAPIK